jgi:branched-chain amino acid transport system ATP-binding protein
LTGNGALIEVHDIHKHFGGFHAVDGASLRIETGSITGLVGPNGAGKTTLFNVIAGVLPPTSGTVIMDGEDITGLTPHELFAKGLLRTFQIAHEFSSMTCRENLMMVPAGQSGESLWNTWFGRARIAEEERALRAKADEVLEFLTIEHLADHPAGRSRAGRRSSWSSAAR